MPFKSEKQRRFMWWKHPEIAKRWTEKYGSKIKKKSARQEAAERLYKKKGG